MEIKHILVATDLSPEARLSYRHAAALAERFDARVTLLHVTERVDLSFMPTRDLVRQAEELAADARRCLEDERRWFIEQGCVVAIQTATGSPAEEVIHVCEREGVDLCILSRHGQGRSRHFLVGSTAKRVLRHIRCPFLMVPPQDEAASSSDAKTPAFQGYRRLLTTTDFGRDSERGLGVAAELAVTFAADLTLTHVAHLPSELVTGAEGAAVRLPQDTLDWLKHHNANRLEAAVETFERTASRQGVEADGLTLTTHVVIDNSPAAGIVGASLAVGADMIVLPSHGKGAFRAILLGSTSERVIKLSRVPVLVLPRGWLESRG